VVIIIADSVRTWTRVLTGAGETAPAEKAA
jgi:hypothetical protein